MRRYSFIVLLLFAFIFALANSNMQFLKKKRKSAKPQETTAVNDTFKKDSVGKGSDTLHMDSLQLAIFHHNKAIDDSIRLDSINRSKKNGIDAPVVYMANDSLVYDATSKTARLYGDANVKYETMNLKSEKVYMSLDSSIVHATGVYKDSAQKELSGTPVAPGPVRRRRRRS